jgi:hypothetical protein
MTALKAKTSELREALKEELPNVKFEVRGSTNGGWANVITVKADFAYNSDAVRFWEIAIAHETRGITVNLSARD